MRSCAVLLLALGLVASPAMGFDGDQDGPGTKPATQSELQEMRELIRAQAAQLEEQRRQLQQEHERVRALEERLGMTPKTSTESSAASAPASVVEPPIGANPLIEKTTKEAKSSPLSFKIGAAEFTPGGFADFSASYRSKNVGSGIATSYGSIPFDNTPAGNLSEFRIGAQNSRLSLKVDSTIGKNKVIGYAETDFFGSQPASAYVTSNSNTLRMRMYMVDVTRDKWEVLAGQAWTLLTPNRRGVSAMPADLFISLNADSNYQLGLVWARQPQFRVVYHPNSAWAIGVSVENPQQYVGSAVTFPAKLADVAKQFDNGSNTATPNVRPDIIAKIAHDRNLGGGRNWHVELAGFMRSFKAATPATATRSIVSRSVTGGGVSLNNIVDVSKNFRLIGTTFWSDGGGRYILGLGPDAVIRPIGSGKDAIARPGLVHSGAGVAGFEWQAAKNTVVSGYYGGAYFQRYAFVDTTSDVPGTLAGFGYTGSSTSANRALQEVTLGVGRTFWKDPNYGALMWVTQTSYLTRSPWYVPAGSPKNAHLVLGFMELRYVLP